MLKRRFGNQQRIIDKHMEVLLSRDAKLRRSKCWRFSSVLQFFMSVPKN